MLAFERAALDMFGRGGGPVDFPGGLDGANAAAWIEGAGGTPDGPTVAEFKGRVAAHLPAALEERRHAGRVLPGVPELLDALTERGVHHGLLTGNWRETGRMKLAAYGLDERFSWGAWGGDAERRPDLVPVALARAEEAGWGGEGPVWVVGDTYKDVAAAREHSHLAAGVLTGPEVTHEPLKAAEPDALFEDLSDTPAVLEAFGLPI